MKRLLAYLFIVFGFGLNFNINTSIAGTKLCVLFKSYSSSQNQSSAAVDNSANAYASKNVYYIEPEIGCETSLNTQFNFLKKFLDDAKNNYQVEKLLGEFKAYKAYGADPKLFVSLIIENDDYYEKYFDLMKKNGYERNKKTFRNAVRYIAEYREKFSEKSTVVKKEPSKKIDPQVLTSQKGKGLDLLKQQVEWKVWVKHVDKDYKNQKPYIGDSDYIIYDIEKSKYLINPKNPKEEAIFIAKEKCRKDNPNNPDGCLIDKINEGSNKTRKTSSYDRPTETKYYYEEELKNYLAKKGSSQIDKENKSKKFIKWKIVYKRLDQEGLFSTSESINPNLETAIQQSHDKCRIQKRGAAVCKLFSIEEHNSLGVLNIYSLKTKTQIAKAEPTVTPKKKIEVAKVEELKQEEFKPKKTNQDKDPPVIEIAQNITVSDTSYVIEGKVSDKSDKIFVEIDGQPIEVNKGKFKASRYSPVDEQIEIVAIDQWGNRSKPKKVNIKIDLKQTKVASKIEPLNPSNLKTKTDKNKVALIIGVEKYENSPSAKYASLDAKYFKDYARKAFGVRDDNINLLTDEDANLSKTNSAIFKWLPSKIKKNKTDLIIFYSGHGLASADGKEKYILPHNADPDLLSRTAISRNDIFDQIVSLNPRSVTIFFDTCYSGVSRDEQMLLASARPLRIVADDENEIPNNFTLFSASANDQISSGLKNAKHGIFSYFLMKGLEGEADLDGDRKLTNGELITYLNENVSENALNLGRQQNPSLIGNSEKVLIRF